MSIEIQRRQRRPASLSEWLAKLAPKGLNTNTQFFLVFLAVLALHLVLAPVIRRAATHPEPGEPQRYLTSSGGEASASAVKTAAQKPDTGASVPPVETLVLTDGKAKEAAPAVQSDVPKPKAAPIPAPKIPATPEPAKSATVAKPVESATQAPVDGPAVAKPVATPVEGPKISDLIESAGEKPAAELPAVRRPVRSIP